METPSSARSIPTKIPQQRRGLILSTRIDAVTWNEALEKIEAWANKFESRYVCICNVHSVATASRDLNFATTLAKSDMATPDGAPIAWALRRMGFNGQQRINGPDLMFKYFAKAEKNRQAIFLYGGSQSTLDLLQKKLPEKFPSLIIAGAYSPPFRTLTAQEDQAIIERINNSGAGTVWVSLGCPKQEIWMESHKNRINAVMIGVGAAFDYHAGTISRAPDWMQHIGLEWLFRLAAEPSRLWKRYLVTNSIFIARIPKSIWDSKLRKNTMHNDLID